MRDAILVLGCGFGDEGKGSIVDAVVRTTGARLVVRFNGGANAGHTVVHGAEAHTFCQYGSGTFAGARTFLSRFVLWDPLALAAEHAALAPKLDQLATVLVDPYAPVITPWHRAVNHFREIARGTARDGSCGVGLGELARDLAAGAPVIRARDLYEDRAALVALADAVRRTQADKTAEILGLAPTPGALLEISPEVWVSHVSDMLHLITVDRWSTVAAETAGTVVFEGAQGVLLDEVLGFHPHTTWTRCTAENADILLNAVAFTGPRRRLGVLRAFATRHGAGPLPSEVIPVQQWTVGEHNLDNVWQGPFRYGHFDVVLARYALEALGGVDGLALTCLDRAAGYVKLVTAYAARTHPLGPAITRLAVTRSGGIGHQTALTRQLQQWSPVLGHDLLPVAATVTPDRVAAALETPIWVESHGPAAEHKRWSPLAPWVTVPELEVR